MIKNKRNGPGIERHTISFHFDLDLLLLSLFGFWKCYLKDALFEAGFNLIGLDAGWKTERALE